MTHKKPLYNNNASSQRQRILKDLKEEGPLHTFKFRKKGISHPAGRINGLRKTGHKILTNFVNAFDDNGVAHRIAQYSYHGKEVKHV